MRDEAHAGRYGDKGRGTLEGQEMGHQKLSQCHRCCYIGRYFATDGLRRRRGWVFEVGA